jgi:hypothetical protein
MFLKRRPPVTVIIVCAFELIGLILLPSVFFKQSTKEFGLWYQMYLALCGILSVIVIWLLWKMRRMGVYIYFIMYTIHNIVAVIVHNWLIYVLIIPLIGAMLLLPHIKKMDKDASKDFA